MRFGCVADLPRWLRCDGGTFQDDYAAALACDRTVWKKLTCQSGGDTLRCCQPVNWPESANSGLFCNGQTFSSEFRECLRFKGLFSEWAWSALHSLTVGHFRGFRVAETFNFPQRITMFYGPNGSGKTSLCEALELALLVAVDEASAKRIPAQRYFANLLENRYEAPTLAARGAEPPDCHDSFSYRGQFFSDAPASTQGMTS